MPIDPRSCPDAQLQQPTTGLLEFADATLFLGMNSTRKSVRVACKSFFVARLKSQLSARPCVRLIMSLEQVGRCDDLVWQFPREVQDAYYPFMDHLHSVMAIERLGYEDTDLRKVPDDARLFGTLPVHERLLLGMVANRGGMLRSVSHRLLAQPDLPVLAPAPGPELSFPEPLERLYRQSLALRLPTEAL